jgi:3-oxoacyl-[acyl-carrier-protein] synthase-3
MPSSVIIGSGSCVPERVIEGSHFLNSEFYTDEGDLIDKPADEIIKKFVEITEIETRRYINDDEFNSDLGYKAAKEAIYDASIEQEEIDYIIYASNFGEVSQNGMPNFMPNMAARVKNKLGIKNRKCITYDMIFGCPGWVEGMVLADDLIKLGKAKTILVIGGETLSRVTDPFDRNKMIFADGAGAVILQKSDEENVGIIATNTVCDNAEELMYLECSPTLNPNAEDQDTLYIRMRGRKIYEYALKNVPSAVKETMDAAGISVEDIDKILMHQANAKMDYAMVSRLFKLYGKSEYDHNVSPMTIQQFGNSSVATIPTMYDLIAKGEMEGHEFKKGGYIVIGSVGAGMNINCIVYKTPQ